MHLYETHLVIQLTSLMNPNILTSLLNKIFDVTLFGQTYHTTKRLRSSSLELRYHPYDITKLSK